MDARIALPLLASTLGACVLPPSNAGETLGASSTDDTGVAGSTSSAMTSGGSTGPGESAESNGETNGDPRLDVPPPHPEGGLGPWDFGYVEFPEIEAVWVVAADFDGDGNTDVFARDGSNTGRVYAGDGAGGLLELSQRSLPSGAEIARVGDFDGDGDTDLAVFDGYSDSRFSVSLNDGTGTFAAAQNVDIEGFYGFGVTPLHLDADDDHDLFVPQGHSQPNRLAAAQGDGTFALGPEVEPFGCYVSAAAAGDLDGDGLDDVVHTGSCNAVPELVPLAVLLNTGGALSLEQTILADVGPVIEGGDVVLLDIEPDGDLDVLTGTLDALVLALNDGAGALADPPEVLPTNYPGAMRQIIPVVLSPPEQRAFLLTSSDDVETSAAALFTVTMPAMTTSTDLLDLQGVLAGAADFDGDGRPDPMVLIPEPGGSLGIWLSGG